MAVSAGGIRAGAAYVELSVKDSQLVKGLNAAAARLKAFGASVAGLGARLAALGGTAMAPVTGMVSHFVSAGDALNKMAARTGISVEALSELGFAAEQSGADLETLESGIKAMQRNIVAAAEGSREMRAKFAELKLTVADLKALTPEEQFILIADRISQINNPTKRATLAMDIFNKANQKLIPMLLAGAKGIEELRAEANRLGFTISAEQAQAAADLGDAWNRLSKTYNAAAFAIGGALAPELTALLDKVTQFVVGLVDWAKENKAVIITVAKVTAAVVGTGAALIAAGGAILFVGAAIGGLVSIIMGVVAAFKILFAVVAAILTPIGLVTAALVGLGYLFVTQTDAGKRMTDELSAGFTSFAETAKTAWGGIVDAIQAGDLGLAAKIALAAIKLEWAKAVLWWTEKWNAFKGIFVDGWHDVVAGLKLMFWDFTAWIARTFAWAIEKLFRAAAWVAEKLGLDDLAQNLRAGFDFSSANINRNRDRIKNQILDERIRRQREADAARRADAAAAMDGVRKAADELRAAVKEAERKRAGMGNRVPPKAKAGSMSSLDEVIDLAKKVDIQGTFNALAVRGLGGETLNERAARDVAEIKDAVKKIAAEAMHGGLVFA
jgi:hypothetical protein